jgi:tetratricopeptide (TPR) repeat protein
MHEYLLKGLYLGLWTFLALQVPLPDHPAPPWTRLLWVLGWIVAASALAFLLAATWQIFRGLRPTRHWLAFPLLVLLESPTFIYTGVVGGLMIGVLSGSPAFQQWFEPLAHSFGCDYDQLRYHAFGSDWLAYCAAGGLLFGFGLYRLRQTDDRRWRLWLGLILVAALAYLTVTFLQRFDFLATPHARWHLGWHLLAAIPFFYLLSFCGEAEESEVEIMALAATLGAALYLLGLGEPLPGIGGATVILLPLLLYYVYAVFLLNPLQVFKHVLRGYSYLHVGQLRVALSFFRRALQLDPHSRLAVEGLVRLHRLLTPELIVADPDLAQAVDYQLCLDQAAALLMHPPTPAQQQEAESFLQLVEQKQPALQARVDYLRVLSLLHAHRYEEAAALLTRLLDPSAPYVPTVRRRVLFDAWELALRLHPQMIERVGQTALQQRGRCMEAIAAVEQRLRQQPQDAAARELKTWLYSQLSEAEFFAAAPADAPAPTDFDYDYVEQLGLTWLDDADAKRRERGRAYLRIAARGLPRRAVSIYSQLADAYQKEGDATNARKALELAVQAAQRLGPRQLPEEQYRLYLTAVQRLAQEAQNREDYATAIRLYRQYLEDGGSAALETYRILADLYSRIGDPLNALLMVETGLTYDSQDPELLRQKDTCYYSVDPQRLQEVRDKVAPWFDVDYCVRKATAVLNAKEASLDLLDWAAHLAQLATLMRPQSNAVRLVQARVLLRRGQRTEGVQLLEDIHYDSDKGSGSEEEAWYLATKLLGQLYLDELGKPENALHCFLKYKDYYKSGADTLFQIARCYEALGDHARAVQHYKAVTSFQGHPLVWEAEEALRRLQNAS